jgi:uncharacterized protein (TIGR03790 family)
VVFVFLLLAAVSTLYAQGDRILLVVNRNDAVSRQIGDYYAAKRSVPAPNVCSLATTSDEEITWEIYQQQVENPVRTCLTKANLQEKVLYVVTTLGVPLKVTGSGSGLTAEYASVDSELALLYSKLKGGTFRRSGGIANPFYMQRDAPFRHPQFPMYLVTRLAGYDFADVKAMIDRAQAPQNRGKFVVDLNSPDDDPGNNWLRTAAILLPADRVIIEETSKVLYDVKNVIGYASFGSNDPNRKRRHLGFEWLPGAISAEFVSTSARTVKRPPNDWTFTTWQDRLHFFGGSPQSLIADTIHDGVTGISGNTYEPYLERCVRPDYLLPAYYQGRNLAESYYMALPWLSWQGVILGDPLCSIGKPH